ncbi:TIR domain-containing protein [Bradyrhizobium sp. UFLA01-814]|uniref:TIR domain-containing protein n=1 Tax=Bradyrhizobium sp. UFLA01-814 TaxID=3023480 RepID=UPI00398A9D0F
MKTFEIFCSYAHADNDDGWIEKFVQELSSLCSKLAGERVTVFLDREAMITAQIWEEKIKAALDASGVMIAVLSPSYIRSNWCLTEWQIFEAREGQARKVGLLSEDQGLVFPLLLYPFDRGRFNAEQEAFLSKVKKRQWLDVSSQLPGTPIRPEQLRRLAESILDVLTSTDDMRRQKIDAPNISQGIIVDPRFDLVWSSLVSPSELTYDEAIRYVGELNIDGIQGWRLPSKDELLSLVSETEIAKSPEQRTPPVLREPFNSQRFGYLHSGTLVPTRRSNFIMNVRNGHLFDGGGSLARVRAVRSRTSTMPSAMYVLFRNAILFERTVVCTFQGRERRFVPHIIGKNKVGEEVILAWELPYEGNEANPQWRCLRLANLTGARTEEHHSPKAVQPHSGQLCVSNIDLDIDVHIRNKT